MTSSPATVIVDAYCQAHARILALVEKLSDAQLHWHPTADSLSIAFHVWHVARWADYFQAAIPGMTPELGRRLGPAVQIWEAEDLAQCWGIDPSDLGFAATGMTMHETIAAQLVFPPKAALLAYLRPAFAAVDGAVHAIDDQQFGAAEQPQPLTEGIWGASTVGNAIVVHLVHDNRHLGMIECLAGIQAGSGTATV
jgi:hypothetical protein